MECVPLGGGRKLLITPVFGARGSRSVRDRPTTRDRVRVSVIAAAHGRFGAFHGARAGGRGVRNEYALQGCQGASSVPTPRFAAPAAPGAPIASPCPAV